METVKNTGRLKKYSSEKSIYMIFDMKVTHVAIPAESMMHSVVISVYMVVSERGRLCPILEDAERAGALRKFWSNQKTVELSNPPS